MPWHNKVNHNMSPKTEAIEFSDFLRVEIRSGTIVEATVNTKARVPAYILKIDFGELGLRTSSAQLTKNYQIDDLLGLQIVAVMNFPVKRIAGIKSEVLVLGTDNGDNDIVLLRPFSTVANGLQVC